MRDWFNRVATGCARFTGQPPMLITCMVISVLGILAYVSGDEHFLGGANLALSIVTLLLLPILQASQNRDGAALQAKLDELIKVNHDARNALIGLENRSEAEIERMRAVVEEGVERAGLDD
ncbi:low affinity iron permease family protein [Sphingobium bisphenolivorans]|uniref:low affinity iron permease family protein n=1 Tax=Sphingobium bisphenolivorans TaxID=1335760 RepID=UPI0003B47961|nr:low affinity iron permease family protein [Sphingobium bisphenolivorans]